MTATTPRTTTSPRSGSRSASSCHRNARPANRVAGSKTASRNFFAAPPKTHPENATQTLGTHQENYVCVYDFAPGCAVAPDSAASGTMAATYVGVPGKSVPGGQFSFFAGNAVGSDAALSNQQAAAAVAFMQANSPSFAAALAIRLKERYGLAIVSVAETGGGKVNGAGNLVFGLLTGVRPDGSMVYPAYTIAHELGHINTRTPINREWVVNTQNMTYAQLQIAPNSAEYYAYNFAEQVSREIRQNSGVDIGTLANYWDVGSTSRNMGILPALKN